MITNASKPTTTLANADRIASFETWATIPTTWAGETRTWLDCVSLFDNDMKPNTTFTNVAKPA